ncbi:MAG: ribosome silencing factor [Alphaproteobacteria bacterium]|nr:ribosome silencing factor [Alphaproteobacteria bacterium]
MPQAKKKTTISSTQAAAKKQAQKNEEHLTTSEVKKSPAKRKPCAKKKTTKKAVLPTAPGALSKEQIKELIAFVEQKLDAGKAENIVTIDLKGKSSFTDFIIIANGTSGRHLNGLANNLIQDIKKAGYRARISGDNSDTGWIVIDLIDVMIHLFTGEMRDFYDLEGMWKDQLK